MILLIVLLGNCRLVLLLFFLLCLRSSSSELLLDVEAEDGEVGTFRAFLFLDLGVVGVAVEAEVSFDVVGISCVTTLGSARKSRGRSFSESDFIVRFRQWQLTRNYADHR